MIRFDVADMTSYELFRCKINEFEAQALVSYLRYSARSIEFVEFIILIEIFNKYQVSKVERMNFFVVALSFCMIAFYTVPYSFKVDASFNGGGRLRYDSFFITPL